MSVSASGVSAAPAAPAINVSALVELLEGSTGVNEKLKTYQDAKDAADKALADLRLGNEVVARLEAAKSKEEAADENLAKALKDAERILADAKAQAKSIVDNANEEDARIRAGIIQSQKHHEAWASGVTTEANAAHKAASTALTDAEKTKALHETAMAAARETQKAADKALKEANKLLQGAKERSDKLRAALDAV